MPKSKLRGGAKAHRKRVVNRNNRIKSEQNRFRNIFQKEMMSEFEKMSEQQNDIVEVKDTEDKKGV